MIATCRDPARAHELKGLNGSVEVHLLDVTEQAQIDALAKALKGEAIDLLINNAGIYGPRQGGDSGVDIEAWAEVFRVNTMAPLMVTQGLLDHVARSDGKVIVAMGSRSGSIAMNDSGGAYIYRSSKAALNAVMKSLAVDLKPRSITVVVLRPGSVRTDMGGPSAVIDPPESVAGMRRVIAGLKPADSGRFFDYDGTEMPW